MFVKKPRQYIAGEAFQFAKFLAHSINMKWCVTTLENRTQIMRAFFLLMLMCANTFGVLGQNKYQHDKKAKTLEVDSTVTSETSPYKGDVALGRTLGRIMDIQFVHPARAIKICDSLLNVYPEDELIKIYRINAVYAIRNKQVRIDNLVKFANEENNTRVLKVIIQAFRFVEDTGFTVYSAEAESVATKLIALSSDGDDYYLRGEIRCDLDKYDAALLDYNKAMSLLSIHTKSEIYQSIAFCYKSAKSYFEAIQYFNKVLSTSDQKGNILYNRGICKLELEDYRGAIADFDLAMVRQNAPLSGYPYKPQILLQKARASISLKEYNNAVTYLVTVIKSVGPDNDEFKSRAYNLLGNARYYLKQKALACANWSKAGSLGSREAYDNIKVFCK